MTEGSPNTCQLQQFIQEDVMYIEGPTLSSNVFLYNKGAEATLYISPGIQVNIAFQQLFKARSQQIVEEIRYPPLFKYQQESRHMDAFAVQQEYTNYRRQGFDANSKNILLKQPIKFAVNQIRAVQVANCQIITKRNQPDAPVERCVFVDFQHGEKMKQALIIPRSFGEGTTKSCEKISQNLQLRKLLYASASAATRENITFLKALECDRVDVERPEHFRALGWAGQSVFEYLKAKITGSDQLLQDFCLNLKPDHPLWRRIGFQNAKPQTDFRAAGLFGLLAIVYTANMFPGFVVDGSYAQGLENEEAIRKYLENYKACTYGYPVAVSIIQIAHSLIEDQQIVQSLTSNTHIFNVFVNDYITDAIHFINNAEQLLDVVEKNMNIEAAAVFTNSDYTTDMDKYSEQLQVMKDALVSQLKILDGQVKQGAAPENLFQSFVEFNTTIKVFPTGPIVLGDIVLSAVWPRFGGQFFKLVSYLALEMNRRLSTYDTNKYTAYQGQFAVLISNVTQIMQQGDVLGIDDLLHRVRSMF